MLNCSWEDILLISTDGASAPIGSQGAQEIYVTSEFA